MKIVLRFLVGLALVLAYGCPIALQVWALATFGGLGLLPVLCAVGLFAIYMVGHSYCRERGWLQTEPRP